MTGGFLARWRERKREESDEGNHLQGVAEVVGFRLIQIFYEGRPQTS